MKIDITKDSVSRWALATALGKDEERCKTFMNSPRKYENGLDVVLIVDGVEFDFALILKRMDELYDDAVTRAAGEKYLSDFDRVSDEITEELSEIRDKLKESRAMKFPGIDWDRYE